MHWYHVLVLMVPRPCLARPLYSTYSTDFNIGIMKILSVLHPKLMIFWFKNKAIVLICILLLWCWNRVQSCVLSLFHHWALVSCDCSLKTLSDNNFQNFASMPFSFLWSFIWSFFVLSLGPNVAYAFSVPFFSACFSLMLDAFLKHWDCVLFILTSKILKGECEALCVWLNVTSSDWNKPMLPTISVLDLSLWSRKQSLVSPNSFLWDLWV